MSADRPGAGTPTGSESPRRGNLSAVMRHLHAYGPTSRSDLSALTGLNRSTIGFLLDDLERRGLVCAEAPRGTGTRGRPSAVASVRHDARLALTVEVFGDSVGAGVIGLGGRILHVRRVTRPRGYRSPEAVARDLADIAAPLLHEIGPERVFGIAIAVAALVHDRDGVVTSAPNLGWQEVPIADIVRRAVALDCPVVVANDANLAALAEHTRGAGVGYDDFVLVWGEVGVGAGIVAGGHWVRGRSGFAGEVGHLRLKPDGLECHCGKRGCWETLVAEDAVLRAIGREGAPDAARTLNEALAAAAGGDETVRAGLREIGHWLGVGIGTLVNTLDPRRIALGGLFARLHPWVVEAIRDELDQWSMAAPRSDVEIVPAALGQDAPILGAAELAFRPLLADPTMIPFVDGGSTASPDAGSRLANTA